MVGPEELEAGAWKVVVLADVLERVMDFVQMEVMKMVAVAVVMVGREAMEMAWMERLVEEVEIEKGMEAVEIEKGVEVLVGLGRAILVEVVISCLS